MKRVSLNIGLLLIVFLFKISFSNAQVFGLKVSAGYILYKGDLSKSPFQPDLRQPAVQFALNYEMFPRLDIELSYLQGSLKGGGTKYSPTNLKSLSFLSKITQVDISAKYYWVKMSEYDSRLGFYSGIGFGIVRFDPTKWVGGTQVPLQPFQLEGVAYNRTAFDATIYTGLSYQINKTFVINGQAIFHQPFTDYIDDVSKRGDPSSLDMYFGGLLGIIYRFGNEDDMNNHGKQKGPEIFQ